MKNLNIMKLSTLLTIIIIYDSAQLITAKELNNPLSAAQSSSSELLSINNFPEKPSSRARTESSTNIINQGNKLRLPPLVESRILQEDKNASEKTATGKQEKKQASNATESKIQHATDAEDVDEEESDLLLISFLLLGLGVGAYMARRRFIDNSLYEGRWIVGNQDPDETDDYNVRSLNAGQEMVPLSNEDEWGWEDNARTKRDLEVGGGNGMIGKEDLNSVLRPPTSVSTSDRTLKTSNFKRTNISSKSQKKPSLTQKKVNPSPVLSKSNKSSLPVEPASSWDNESDWGDEDNDEDNESSTARNSNALHSSPTQRPSSSSQTPKPAPVTGTPPSVEELLAEQLKNSRAPAITSFSKPKPAAVSTKPRVETQKRNEEEDIFASMGLSSVPKNTHSSSSTKRTPTVTITQSRKTESSSLKSETLAALSIGTDDAGSDWGNDEDLDDLLEDE